MTPIWIRTEENVKNEALRILEAQGIDLEDAINIFMRQVVIDGKMPFTPSKKALSPFKEESSNETKEMFADLDNE